MKIRKVESIRRFWAADSERYKVYITVLCSQEELEKINMEKVKRLFEEGN